MNENERNKHLDELLDSALLNYSAAEPRPGLETRILANLREAESREASQQWNFKWMWAGVAIAAAVLLLVLSSFDRHPPAVQNNIVVNQQPVDLQPPVRQESPVSKNVTHQQQRRPALVRVENAALALTQRPSIFPTPAPLSDQERLLLSYYARTPREELIAQSHPEEPPAMSERENDITIPDLVSVPQKSSNTR